MDHPDNFEQLKELIVGRTIVDIKPGGSLYDGIGIESIVVEGERENLEIALWGAADMAMVSGFYSVPKRITIDIEYVPEIRDTVTQMNVQDWPNEACPFCGREWGEK